MIDLPCVIALPVGTDMSVLGITASPTPDRCDGEHVAPVLALYDELGSLVGAPCGCSSLDELLEHVRASRADRMAGPSR